jgi:hypothetical protein
MIRLSNLPAVATPATFTAAAHSRIAAALVWLSLLSVASPAWADAYEGFDYPVGPRTTLWRGGSGFIDGSGDLNMPNGWNGSGGGIGAGSLSNPAGTLATSGNHLQLTGAPQDLRRRLGQTFGTPGTDVWVSWLQRLDSNQSTFHGLLFSEPTSPTSSRGLYFIGEPGFGPGNGTYVIGRPGDDLNAVSSGVPVVANETVFLVAHFEFREGNDRATLFVNPAPGAATPTGGVTDEGFDMPLINPIVSFTGMAGGPITYSFDEFRVGDSYAAVAPIVPEPAAALIAAGALALTTLRRRRST